MPYSCSRCGLSKAFPNSACPCAADQPARPAFISPSPVLPPEPDKLGRRYSCRRCGKTKSAANAACPCAAFETRMMLPVVPPALKVEPDTGGHPGGMAPSLHKPDRLGRYYSCQRCGQTKDAANAKCTKCSGEEGVIWRTTGSHWLGFTGSSEQWLIVCAI